MRYHLQPLNLFETQNYIAHRLHIAGGNPEIFDKSAIALIHEQSGGIPRRINQLCDTSLLAGFGSESKIIDEMLVQETIKSLT